MSMAQRCGNNLNRFVADGVVETIGPPGVAGWSVLINPKQYRVAVAV